MLKRLRHKFVLINMVTVMLMICIILGTIYAFTRSSLEKQCLQRMQSIALDPLQQNTLVIGSDEVNLPYFILEITRFGTVLAISDGNFDLSDKEFLLEVAEAASADSRSYGVLSDYNLRYYRLSNTLKDYLIFVDITSEQKTLQNLLRLLLLIGGISFLGFLALSFFLAKWAIRPVEKSWEEQKRFVADASHELKTPLTVILTNAELLSSPQIPQENKATFASNILVTARQMRSLLENMLTLARSDAGASPISLKTVDFSDLLEETLLPYEPVFYEKKLTLETQIEKGLKTEGDETKLRRLIDIYLDNAGKYAPPGSTVTVSLQKQDFRHLRLTVTNPSDPIHEKDLERLYDRFLRLDPSRSRNGSYGLGLAIAKTIVEEHGGKVWATTPKEGMVSFHTTLPLERST